MSVHILSSPGGKQPVWGPQTSKMKFRIFLFPNVEVLVLLTILHLLSFCEEDYHVTGYIGEFINTLTSFIYVFLGGYALYRQGKNGKMEISAALSYLSLIVVGIGSTAFHASLKYELQLVDDLSMLLGGGIMFHYVLTINSGRSARVALFAAVTAVLSLSVWAHITSGDSALHQVVFGTMVITVGVRTNRLVRNLVADRALRSRLRRMGRVGHLTLLAAYTMWLIDVFACPYLRSLRSFVGIPLAWLFELHGWWHTLTAIGVYVSMVISEFLRPEYRSQKLPTDVGWMDLLKGPQLWKDDGQKSRKPL